MISRVNTNRISLFQSDFGPQSTGETSCKIPNMFIRETFASFSIGSDGLVVREGRGIWRVRLSGVEEEAREIDGGKLEGWEGGTIWHVKDEVLVMMFDPGEGFRVKWGAGDGDSPHGLFGGRKPFRLYGLWRWFRWIMPSSEGQSIIAIAIHLLRLE
jgi:hypothetical protein